MSSEVGMPFFPEREQLDNSRVLRKAGDEDKSLIAEMTRVSYRPEGLDPDIFFEKDTDCAIVEDDLGPVMCIRVSKAVRIDIQFMENESSRTGRSLAALFPWFKKQSEKKGFRQLLFESTIPALIGFCGQFGFRKSPCEVVCEFGEREDR